MWVSARLVLCVGSVAGTAILYLALCGRCENLGRDIKRIEAERERVRVEMQTEQLKWSRLTSPRRFREILAKHDLDMSWPEERFVVRLDVNRVRPFEQELARTYRMAQAREGNRHD